MSGTKWKFLMRSLTIVEIKGSWLTPKGIMRSPFLNDDIKSKALMRTYNSLDHDLNGCHLNSVMSNKKSSLYEKLIQKDNFNGLIHIEPQAHSYQPRTLDPIIFFFLFETCIKL